MVHAVAAYERAFKLLEDTLAESGGPWILGADVTLADINLMPFAARLDYLGLLDLWTDGRHRVWDWWTHARAWPSFKSGLHDLISEAEFTEMRTHGPKIRDDIAAHRTTLRRNGDGTGRSALKTRSVDRFATCDIQFKPGTLPTQRDQIGVRCDQINSRGWRSRSCLK